MPWPASGFTQWNAGRTSSPSAVPTTPTTLETVQCWLAGASFANSGGLNRTVQLTDQFDVPITGAFDVPSDGVPVVLEWPLMPVNGIKWGASGSGISGSVWGSK